MELASLNSLAEVGVGLNLAFGLIHWVRDGLTSRFKKAFETSNARVEATVNDAVSKKSGEGNRLVVKAADILHRYSKTADFVTRAMVVVAIVVAACLLVLLTLSARTPKLEVADVYACYLFAAVVVPAVLSAVLQTIVFLSARGYLTWRLKKYDHFTEIYEELNSNISPTMPSGAPSPRESQPPVTPPAKPPRTPSP